MKCSACDRQLFKYELSYKIEITRYSGEQSIENLCPKCFIWSSHVFERKESCIKYSSIDELYKSEFERARKALQYTQRRIKELAKSNLALRTKLSMLIGFRKAIGD